MADTGNRQAMEVILRALEGQTDSQRQARNPFILEFRDQIHGAMTDPWGDDEHNLRKPAMLLAVRMSGETREQQAWLLAGLNDRSAAVRVAAASQAADLGLVALAPQIRAASLMGDATQKAAFCEALQQLQEKCL
jgi:hypothetical protein